MRKKIIKITIWIVRECEVVVNQLLINRIRKIEYSTLTKIELATIRFKSFFIIIWLGELIKCFVYLFWNGISERCVKGGGFF